MASAGKSVVPLPCVVSAPLAPFKIVRFKKRSQFLKIAAKGRKVVRPTLVLQAMELNKGDQDRAKRLARATGPNQAAFIGFTASKKVGNAVARNRAKRRLSAAVRDVFPTQALPGWGYVVIARGFTVSAPFQMIIDDLRAAVSGAGQIRYKKENAPQQDRASNDA